MIRSVPNASLLVVYFSASKLTEMWLRAPKLHASSMLNLLDDTNQADVARDKATMYHQAGTKVTMIP
jgi:hypothetical protein